MTDIAIGKTPSSNQGDVQEELKSLLKEVDEKPSGDFQSLAQTLVQLRNSRIKNASHFLDYGIQSLLG
jgi:hypothetical protein